MITSIVDDVRSWIDLAKWGPQFYEYAARNILDCIRLKRELVDNRALFWVLVSAMSRHDWAGVFQFAIDWSDPYSLPTARITRFVPGKHYHVLDTKFDTWADAVQYIEKSGYRFGGNDVVHAQKEGD